MWLFDKETKWAYKMFNYARSIEKLKNRSIKIKNSLVEYQTVTDMNLKLT